MQPAVPDDAIARATTWLEAWDAQGTHRTGTAGDDAGADWLAREAAALGAEVEIESFAFTRLEPVDAALIIGGTRIEGVPVFDAPPSDAPGIIGRIGPVHSDADLGVAELSPQAVYSGEYQELRRSTRHRGLIIVCKGAHPGLGLLNAEQFGDPYGAPAIHVDSRDRETVLDAVSRGATATLVAHSRRVPAYARNVVVLQRGADPGRPKLVMMTPRSSWWQSTSERGGGLVCWLETLRALRSAQSHCDVVLTANTGHELGHLGLDEFMRRRPGWERAGGATWVHYGANIGATGGNLSMLSNDDALRTATASALAQVGRPADNIAPKTTVPSGETRDIHRAGGRYITLVGSNPLFHLPQDRWPHAVDVADVARIATAAARLVVHIAREAAR